MTPRIARDRRRATPVASDAHARCESPRRGGFRLRRHDSPSRRDDSRPRWAAWRLWRRSSRPRREGFGRSCQPRRVTRGGFPPASAGRAAAVVFLAIVALSAVGADVIAPFDPLEQEVGRRLAPPSREHFFGTDGFGRDVFSRTLHGARVSLGVAIAAVVLAGVAGTGIGLTSAYAGGPFDLIVQRGVDVFLGFPFLVMALIVVVALSPTPLAVALAIALSLFPLITRVARAAALSVANEEYLTVVRSTGAGPSCIILRHLLPASAPPIIAYLATGLGTAVGAEATMSFLGLGVPPPYPSWGRMLQEGSRAYFDAAPWVTLLPGLVLCLTVVSLVATGGGTAAWLDGRRRNARP